MSDKLQLVVKSPKLSCGDVLSTSACLVSDKLQLVDLSDKVLVVVTPRQTKVCRTLHSA